MSAATPDPVGRLIEACVRRGRMPGAAWWIGRDGRCCSRGAAGLAAQLPHTEPAAEIVPYDLASLTKPLCTALLLVLAEQDDGLDLGAPVSSLVPGLKESPFAAATLLSLATHTAGLPAWEPLYVYARDTAGYVERIAALRQAVPPGRALYSDLGYVLLGFVLERVLGARLDALFAARVAGPAGLDRLGFARGGRGYEDAAPTEQGNAYERGMAGARGANHAWRTHVLRGEVHDGNAHGLDGVGGHAGLFGTAEQVARLAGELLQPRRLRIGARARERLLRPVSVRHGRSVGFVAASASGAARGILPGPAPGHTGFSGTSLWIDPAADGIFVLLTNRVHPRVEPRGFQTVRRAFHRAARGHSAFS